MWKHDHEVSQINREPILGSSSFNDDNNLSGTGRKFRSNAPPILYIYIYIKGKTTMVKYYSSAVIEFKITGT